MTYELSLLPEIEEALSQVTYGMRSDQVAGDQFLEELYIDIGAIPSNSLLSQVVHQGIRRRLLRRISVRDLLFARRSTDLVLDVFHCAHDPQGIGR